MALRGQLTRASYLDWNEMLILLQKLERDKEYKFEIMIALGCYTGLRYGDLSQLRWKNVLNNDKIIITEGKTKKIRTIHLNPHLVEIIQRLHKKFNVIDDDEYIFINRFKSKPINIQYVNRRLKEIVKKYNLKIEPNSTSTHVFRKTLGRHTWEKNNYSEKSLIMLSDLFNHSSTKITKVYLGIKQQEIGDIYLNL